jgi:hypothetical protein
MKESRMTKNEQILRENILAMSENQEDFDIAKKEWLLRQVSIGSGVCLCGHSPITKLCKLQNKFNHKTTIVGSTCVQKFIGIKTDTIFRDYKLIKEDIEAWIDVQLINYLRDAGIINDWEYDFLVSTHGKKFKWLSPKQQAKRIQINEKILKHMEIVESKSIPVEERELAELTSGPGDLDPEWWK